MELLPKTEPAPPPTPECARTVELIRRSQDGDREALNELFTRYWQRVFAIVRQRMGPGLRRVLDVEDVVQSTFEAAVKDFDRFELRHEAAFIHWLSKLAERQIQSIARSRSAQMRDRAREVALQPAHTDAWASSLSWELIAAGVPVPEHLAQRELVEMVEDCLDELPHDWREVILLRTFAGAEWEYVAAEMGRSTVAAAQELHRRACVRVSVLLGERLGRA